MGAIQLITRKNLQNTRVLRIFRAKILTEGQEPLPAFVNWPRKRKETNRICKQRSRALHKYILEGWLPRETGNRELYNKQKGLPNKFADLFLGNYDENCWNLQDFTIFLNLKVGQKNSLVITPRLFRKYKKLLWHLCPAGLWAIESWGHLEFFGVSQLLQLSFLESMLPFTDEIITKSLHSYL